LKNLREESAKELEALLVRGWQLIVVYLDLDLQLSIFTLSVLFRWSTTQILLVACLGFVKSSSVDVNIFCLSLLLLILLFVTKRLNRLETCCSVALGGLVHFFGLLVQLARCTAFSCSVETTSRSLLSILKH
jgi:hypothetical protein